MKFSIAFKAVALVGSMLFSNLSDADESKGFFVAIDVGTYQTKQDSVQTINVKSVYTDLEQSRLSLMPTVGYQYGGWIGTFSYLQSGEISGVAYGSEVQSTPGGKSWKNEDVSFSRRDSIFSAHIGKIIPIYGKLQLEIEVGMSTWKKRVKMTSTVNSGNLSIGDQRVETFNTKDLSYTEEGWSSSGKIGFAFGDDLAKFKVGLRHISGVDSTVIFLGVMINLP